MSNKLALNLGSAWYDKIGIEFDKPYLKELGNFLRKEKAEGKVIYPNSRDIFKAFELTPYDKVKVVILGQDPYHGPKQAHGLSFSVLPPVAKPPSLRNIFKELYDDLGIAAPNHGCLTPWAKQGVLLLNSVLTVEHGKPGSHQGIGWEQFTDQVITMLNHSEKPIVFVLWGSHAQRKGEIICQDSHVVITSSHPSPLSARRSFFGSKMFSRINTNLKALGRSPINWQLDKAH